MKNREYHLFLACSLFAVFQNVGCITVIKGGPSECFSSASAKFEDTAKFQRTVDECNQATATCLAELGIRPTSIKSDNFGALYEFSTVTGEKGVVKIKRRLNGTSVNVEQTTGGDNTICKTISEQINQKLNNFDKDAALAAKANVSTNIHGQVLQAKHTPPSDSPNVIVPPSSTVPGPPANMADRPTNSVRR